MDFLRVRSSSRLFTLGSADLIRSKVSFPNSGEGAVDGTIMMLINDEAGEGTDVDPQLDGALVVFNATDQPLKQRVEGLAGRVFMLHEAQATGADAVVKDASFDAQTGVVEVPARTVAVFTQRSGDRVTPGPIPSDGTWVRAADGRWWLSYPDGTYPANVRIEVGGATYAFDAAGWMKTGWDNEEGEWRYYAPSGAMATGWLSTGGSWYYLDPQSGVMAIGWLDDNGTWYYLSGSGAMATGWQHLGSNWYYLHANGAMATGWLNLGGTWYFLTGSGEMAVGWVKEGQSWYFCHPSGAMATGRITFGGTTYNFDASGRLIP